MNSKYFTDIKNDVLDNDDLSLGAKGLYCLVCYDLTVSLRKLLLNPDTKAQTIEYANELMKYDYAHFDNKYVDVLMAGAFNIKNYEEPQIKEESVVKNTSKKRFKNTF